MVGGAFLCYEGFEKLAHRFLHDQAQERAHRAELAQVLSDPAIDVVQAEKGKIKGAVRTDFILSAEIIAITLGTVAAAPLVTQVLVLTGIAILMTVGVYGLVAGVVKLDDAGLHLSQVKGESAWARLRRRLGMAILTAAPWLMKALSIAGTAAMFLVGGGILVHGIPFVHHALQSLVHTVAALPALGAAMEILAEMLANAIVGVIAGALVLAVVSTSQKLLRPRPA
jgi:predicted DNA repair protein MutK